MNNKYFNSFRLSVLLCLVLLVNFSGVMYPILRNDDPPLYANIAKHIVLSNNWLDLIFLQQDWLDKPHFPFWITAISFKIFGINSFAYILPGFIFHILGAVFTYKLAKTLYDSKDVGLIAVVIYTSSLHLLISSIDVRAEAYLLGEIMGGCYCWYQYNKYPNLQFKYLIGGAICSALAMMTKGMFVLITIYSGLVCMWWYKKQLANLLKIKWLITLVLSFIFIVPELYALYMQFDLHPEKIIFAHSHISGIRWFFWDSQFGRFFNIGPIAVNKVQPAHYFFFIHTFLWAFLPWSVMFVYVLWQNIKKLSSKFTAHSEIACIWFLLGSFFPTFILFSLTSFQLDHYTNIIMPFATILCARWLYEEMITDHSKITHPVFTIQIWLSYILTMIVIVSSIFILDITGLIITVCAEIAVLLAFVLFTKCDNLTKAILYPALTIALVFIFMEQINQIYAKYDLGYQSELYINKLEPLPVIDYKINSTTLQFYNKTTYVYANNNIELKKIPKPYYLVCKTSDLALVEQVVSKYAILLYLDGTTIDKVLSTLFNTIKLKQNLIKYVVIEVK